MSAHAPESAYLTWLRALSDEEHARVEVQAEAIEFSIRALVAINKVCEHPLPLGVWLHALYRVCLDLEGQLRDSQDFPPKEDA